MAHLYTSLEPVSQYWDKRSAATRQEWLQKLKHCTTVYVGNLAYYTKEEQILELFSKVGKVKRIVMGLNNKAKNPCGFCFVQYFTHSEADRCVKFLNGSICDSRIIRVDWDSGEGIDSNRKYGRGPRGYQWRDEFRVNYDEGRGGEGGKMQRTQLTTIISGKRPRDQFESQESYNFSTFSSFANTRGRPGRNVWNNNRLVELRRMHDQNDFAMRESSYRLFGPTQAFRPSRRKY